MDLEGTEFKGLQRLPVQLTGSWSDYTLRDWRGTAISTVPLVGMSFLQSPRHCEWCNSERDEASPEVRLTLFPYDDVGVDVQAGFTVGHGGRRWRTLVPSRSYRPELPASQVLQTARIFRFATVDGDPPIRLFVLFLARSDVESSRSTLWRVREQLASGFDEPFRRWLQYGRTGTCEG
jgi:hypothetical protein